MVFKKKKKKKNKKKKKLHFKKLLNPSTIAAAVIRVAFLHGIIDMMQFNDIAPVFSLQNKWKNSGNRFSKSVNKSGPL